MLKLKGERITGHEINCFKEQKQDDGTDHSFQLKPWKRQQLSL